MRDLRISTIVGCWLRSSLSLSRQLLWGEVAAQASADMGRQEADHVWKKTTENIQEVFDIIEELGSWVDFTPILRLNHPESWSELVEEFYLVACWVFCLFLVRTWPPTSPPAQPAAQITALIGLTQGIWLLDKEMLCCSEGCPGWFQAA